MVMNHLVTVNVMGTAALTDPEDAVTVMSRPFSWDGYMSSAWPFPRIAPWRSSGFKKADKLGHPKGAYWATWLNNYGNCIGFRDQQERNAIGALRCPADPVGVVFHNSGERIAYIRRMAKEFDRIEAEQAKAQAARSSQTTDTGCTMAGGIWHVDTQSTFGGWCN